MFSFDHYNSVKATVSKVFNNILYLKIDFTQITFSQSHNHDLIYPFNCVLIPSLAFFATDNLQIWIPKV